MIAGDSTTSRAVPSCRSTRDRKCSLPSFSNCTSGCATLPSVEIVGIVETRLTRVPSVLSTISTVGPDEKHGTLDGRLHKNLQLRIDRSLRRCRFQVQRECHHARGVKPSHFAEN